MLTSFLYFAMIVLVYGEPYNCKNKYVPGSQIGYLRVPTDCTAIIPSYCPRSWKSGVPNGRATTKPLIYSEFIKCHEGFSSCGYVPINPQSGEVLGKSGVTIGAGVDLGSKSTNAPSLSSLSNSFISKLEPYFGLRQNLAACAVIERPVNLSSSEATSLTNAVKEHVAMEVEQRYNKDKGEQASVFISLARGIRTAIVSVWFQFGYPEAYPEFWKFVTENNWEKAVEELRNFYKNPNDQLKGDLRRRNDEADIIEATMVECNRSIDYVILLDESSSVSRSDFAESLSFVKNLTKAFPDQKLQGSDGTRFGLSTFSSFYTPRFFLSSHTSQSQYETAVDRVRQRKGSTYLGIALTGVVDQFTEQRGLRVEARGIPRILIVLTDGVSQDTVEAPAKHLQAKNIVIYAIGIGNYDRRELEQIASSTSHVYTLSTFSVLETFIATLTAATCHEPRPVSLDKKIQTTSTQSENLYFLYYVNLTLNLKINVTDLAGETFLYVSRSNPHPYKYDNDLSFTTSSQKSKILVISARALNSNVAKRSIGDRDMKTIYVSVTASTETAMFTIEGDTCNPLNCTEGTNEALLASTPNTCNPLNCTKGTNEALPASTRNLAMLRKSFSFSTLMVVSLFNFHFHY